MSWSTSNEYCGTCRSWKGERQVKRVSDRVVAVFPHANERGRCVEKNDTRAANTRACGEYKFCF